MKTHQWATIGALLLLVAATVAAFVVTDLKNSSTATTKQPSSQANLVDVSVLNTTRGLASLALGPEEQKLSQEAARIADHEVDLAFADGLREARGQTSDKDPKYRELNTRIHDAQAAVDDDKAQLARLKAKAATAKGDEADSLQDQIALLDAQQAPDEDELAVAQEDLILAGGDRESAIQQQREVHEANEDHLAQNPASAAQAPPVDLSAANLAGQVQAWFWLRNKQLSLESARRDVQDLGRKVQAQHDILARAVTVATPQRQQVRAAAAGLRENRARGTISKEASAAAVEALQRSSNNQKLLSGYGKQLQDVQELAGVYGDWIGVAASQQRTLLHGMLRSLLWILLIISVAYLASCLVDGFFDEATAEQKRLITLRAVVRFALQATAVLLIGLVIFGAPNQAPTVLGLAGAGLTVALKDFIVGFFGWFVLMGRNGIRVGDWVEINGVVGEVTEIGLLRTVLLETGNWTDTGHPTGRKVAFVNSYAIEGHYFNFSTAGQWLWDELQVTIPQGENPYPLVESIQKLVEDETKASASQAETEWQKSAGSRMKAQSVAPAIHLRPTGSGVELQVRYITSANERYAVRSRMYEKIVGLLQKTTNATVTAHS